MMTPAARTLFSVLLFLLLTSACADSIEQDNLDATITAIGPIALDAQDRILVTYAIRDLEGDDQNITLEICEKDAKRCGSPDPRGKNSGSLTSLPTRPPRTDVTHTFSFDTACGRLVDNKSVPFELNTPYIVRIQINDSDNQFESTEFTLGTDLGLSAIPSCS